jgi:hypothetical protein
MLNQTRVLSFIKHNLGFPFQHLEFEDEQIVEYFTTYSLRSFSQYVPEVKKIPLTLSLEANKVPGLENEFYITDPQNLEILNVVELYFKGNELYMHGHPFFGPWTHFEIREWALASEMANQLKSFSSFDTTFEFTHPNVLRISPIPTENNVIVEYERIQPEDLRGIPNEFQILFCEYCLADIMVSLGRVRKKYGDGNMRTPFGEIPIGSEIFDEGKEKKRELIEKLERLALPNVTIEHG